MKQTIFGALDDVTAAAEHLVEAETRARHRGYIIITFVFLLGLVGWRWDGHNDCVAANARREDLRGAFRYMAEFAIPDGSPPDKILIRETFSRGIDSRLPERPCRLLPEL